MDVAILAGASVLLVACALVSLPLLAGGLAVAGGVTGWCLLRRGPADG